MYRWRNGIEQLLRRRKGFRRISSCFEKLDVMLDQRIVSIFVR